MSKKKTLFSGIQPSGTLTIGNYMGAFKQWIAMQDSHHCIFSVVDLHAITVKQNPEQLRNNIFDSIASLIACGIDPKKSILFVQSTVSEHTQLAWVLNCSTYMGELNRMTQFKDKSLRHKDNINLGLFAYPSLQAADILLYQTDLVPVGEDQKQHIKLYRDLANRFNTNYKPVFKLPEPIIPIQGARIMSLQDPLTKMSKSDPNMHSYISLQDSEDLILKKFKKSVTDSDSSIIFDKENKPGVANLLNLLSLATGTDIKTLENDFSGKGYGDLKIACADAFNQLLTPIQTEFKKIRQDHEFLSSIITDGKKRAEEIASKTIQSVYDALGLSFT